ncbi:vWA domain-containing protein [Nesterenkonia flava]|uniref:VWA domain-containing protein n=1 Tax=Nesterenkonia flava TaxID=469799 RepID=A0ABU1FPZ8_9MICC|nr:VWA domain-containing protein [Nesterenkonia flava]MDR5710728.1 VWA domain-containing protein [Nesterenkonia flava]
MTPLENTPHIPTESDTPTPRCTRTMPVGRTLTAMGIAVALAAFSAPGAGAATSPASGADSDSADSDSAGGDSRDADDRDSEDEPEGEAPGADLYLDEDSELLLVMDASRSMLSDDAGGQTRIDAARDALHSVVDTLEEQDGDHHVGLRVFASEVEDYTDAAACSDSELAVPIDTDNIDDLREAIDSYKAVGGATPLAYALEQAAEDLSDEGNRTIVLVSDGAENCVPDPCEAAEAIAEQGIDLQIHTVGFQIDEDEAEEAREQLRCIAEAGGGQYFDAEDAETLTHTLERVSQRAYQPFSLQGERVEGGANWGDAPELSPNAQYIDELSEEKLHYRIPRELENSSLHVALTTHNAEGEADWVEAELSTWHEDRCDRDSMIGTEFSTRDFLRTAQLVAYRDLEKEAGEDPCAEDDELVLSVEFQGDDPETVGQPFEITIYEEPEAANQEDLPEATERAETEWTDMGRDPQGAVEVYGGNSFNNAPILEPGTTYDGDILPGEALVFRVPVEWGETLQAEAYFPEPDEELSENLSGSGISSGLTVMSPMRGIIDSDFNSVWRNMSTELQVQSHEVRWNNRGSNQSDVEYTHHAGYQYVVLVADHHDDGDSFTVPYRLTVATFGEASEGAPEYPEGMEDSSPAVIYERDDEDSDEDETSPEGDDEDRNEQDSDGDEDSRDEQDDEDDVVEPRA